MTSIYLDKEHKVKVNFEEPPEEETVNALKEAYKQTVKQEAPTQQERIHTRG